MKFGQIHQCYMTNITYIFLAQCWRLSISSRLFYDFVKMAIQRHLAVFNSSHLRFLNVPYLPFKKRLPSDYHLVIQVPSKTDFHYTKPFSCELLLQKAPCQMFDRVRNTLLKPLRAPKNWKIMMWSFISKILQKYQIAKFSHVSTKVIKITSGSSPVTTL